MEVVRGGVQNAINQLTGAAPVGNSASFAQGAGYVHPARSAAEIKADMAARRQAQPEQFAQVFEEEAAEQDDLFDRLTRTIGPEPGVQQDETTRQPDNGDPMPWMF